MVEGMAGRQVTLAIAGDVMLGRLVNEVLLSRKDPEYVWGDVLPQIRQAEAFLVNLECALTSHQERWHDHGRYKAFYFRSEPEHVEVLGRAEVSFASLANNHVLDFGVPGMRETVRVLDRAGIAHAGAGQTLAEARMPARIHAGELRIAVLAFADHPEEWAAAESAPGIDHIDISMGPAGLGAVSAAIAGVRDEADLLITSLHWGPNMRASPSKEFRDFARAVIDAGADIFWGHSAHVAQAVEPRNGKLILYDTGDFVDDYAVDADLRNDLSALFLVRLDGARVDALELLPVLIANEQVNVATGAARDRFTAAFTARCAELGTPVEAGRERLTIPVAARR